MISQDRLEQWQKQHQKDVQQYKKDENYLKSMETPENKEVRSFFERMRSKFFNFSTNQHQKLNRLLQYIEVSSQILNYPKIMKTYVTYNTTAIVLLGVCFLAPKKMISKIILSLVVYGLKLNIGDGLMTYYMVQNMALGQQMTQKEQQIRNVLQFYYKRNQFNQKPMTEQEKIHTEYMLEQIKVYNQKYQNFKKVQNLL